MANFIDKTGAAVHLALADKRAAQARDARDRVRQRRILSLILRDQIGWTVAHIAWYHELDRQTVEDDLIIAERIVDDAEGL